MIDLLEREERNVYCTPLSRGRSGSSRRTPDSRTWRSGSATRIRTAQVDPNRDMPTRINYAYHYFPKLFTVFTIDRTRTVLVHILYA